MTLHSLKTEWKSLQKSEISLQKRVKINHSSLPLKKCCPQLNSFKSENFTLSLKKEWFSLLKVIFTLESDFHSWKSWIGDNTFVSGSEEWLIFWSEISLFWSDFRSILSKWSITRFVHSFTLESTVCFH